jgi:hypothetical protein
LGNLDPAGQQNNLTFIVQQQLHPSFRRLADDLYAIVSVPLVTGKHPSAFPPHVSGVLKKEGDGGCEETQLACLQLVQRCLLTALNNFGSSLHVW